jgi:hypothetical protein
MVPTSTMLEEKTQEAIRMKLLRESLDREPPEPSLDGDLPTEEEFYNGDIPEWTPNEDVDH